MLSKVAEKDRLKHIWDEKAYIEEEFVHDHEWDEFSDDDQHFDQERFRPKHESYRRPHYDHGSEVYDLSPLEEIEHGYGDHSHAREHHETHHDDRHYDYGYGDYWTAPVHHEKPRAFDQMAEEKLWYAHQFGSDDKKPFEEDFYSVDHMPREREVHEYDTWGTPVHHHEDRKRLPEHDFREELLGERFHEHSAHDRARH